MAQLDTLKDMVQLKHLIKIKIEFKDNFDIKLALDKAFNIYNNTVHSTIKIEPIKALKIKKTKLINKIISNMIKSQIDENKNTIFVKKGSKGLLSSNFKKEGKFLKETLKKGKYNIPIIIESAVGGTKYKFKVKNEGYGLKLNVVYTCNYKMIKF